jgi:hypothetical protein
MMVVSMGDVIDLSTLRTDELVSRFACAIPVDDWCDVTVEDGRVTFTGHPEVLAAKFAYTSLSIEKWLDANNSKEFDEFGAEVGE